MSTPEGERPEPRLWVGIIERASERVPDYWERQSFAVVARTGDEAERVLREVVMYPRDRFVTVGAYHIQNIMLAHQYNGEAYTEESIEIGAD